MVAVELKSVEIKLRPYQEECVEKVIDAYQKDPSGTELIVIPTAGGKTVIFSHVIDALNRLHGLVAMVIAHRDELIEQAADKYRMVKPHAVIGKVGSGVHQYGGELTVASIATISRPEHIKRLKLLFGTGKKLLLIVDESHHVASESYQKVLVAFPDAFKLFVTATPDRLDGKPILPGKQPLYSASIIDMIQQGYLCNVRCLAIKTTVNLDELHTSLGDFNTDELEKAVDIPQRNQRVVDAYKERAPDRRAIVFGVTVKHAQNLAQAFRAGGIPAGVVSGDTPIEERKKLYKSLRDGSIRVLCNVQVLTEGFDMPQVDCVIMARPTQSRSLYVQCIDTATQILTPDGWKSYHEVKKGDMVAGYDKETKEIRWVPALGKFERPLSPDENMFALQSPTLDIRVTGGHRMLFQTRHRSRYDYTTYGLPQWRFIEAQELAKKRSEYVIPIAGKQQASGIPLSDDELRFIGWFLTDGSYNPKNGQIAIYQAAHQPHHEAIKNCLQGCGFKYTICEMVPNTQYKATSHQIRYLISKGQPRGTDKHLSGWGKLEKYIDKDFSPHLEGMTAEQLEILLEAIHLGDGAKQNGQSWTRQSYHIITGNLVFAERLQSLCVRRGFKCNIAYVPRPENPAYHIHIKKKVVGHVGGQNYTDRPHLELSPSTSGETVWCVENELSTLITRRNGKVAIVGNCIGRGLRLAPAKQNCLILDLTDNCLKHRLEPQTLRKVLNIRSMQDDETVTEAVEREEEEKKTGKAVLRKLKENRSKDLQIDLMQKLDWQPRDGGLFVLTVGREQHRIALVPGDTDGYYSVWARLFPGYEAQQWLADSPLDWAQQVAEKEARKLLADPGARNLVDRNAAWRSKLASPGQLGYLRRFRIPHDEETLTRGQASEMIDAHKEKLEQKKAAKQEKEKARAGA